MKKVLSILLSAAMLISCAVCINFSAYALDKENAEQMVLDQEYNAVLYENGNSRNSVFSYDCKETGSYVFSVSESPDADLNVTVSDSDDNTNYYQSYDSFKRVINLDAGKTYYFSVADNNLIDCERTISLRKNAVESIEYDPVEPFEIIENTRGYWTSADGEEFYCYYTPDFNLDDKLTINYADGTSDVYTYCSFEGNFRWANSEGVQLNENDFYYQDDQYSDHWAVGKDNHFTVSYSGCDITIDVTIIESPALSISFKSIEPIEIFEHTEGMWTGDGYWYYYEDYICKTGNVITVNYTDGRIIDYTGDWYDGYFKFVSESGEVLNYETDTVQNTVDNPWTAGNTYYVDLTVFGCTTQIPVTIVENPIESLNYIPNDTAEYIQNTNGHWEKDENNKDYYYYRVPESCKGDKLVVKYKSGLSEIYVYNGFEWADQDGDPLDSYYLDYCDDQYTYHWTLGTKNYYTISYYGLEAKVPVTIVENPVKSVSYTPAAPIEMVQNFSGYWDKDNNGEEFFFYNIPDFSSGDKLTVEYTNGATVVYLYNDFTGWSDPEGNEPDYDEFDYNSNQYSKHWTLGSDNYYTLSYYGIDMQVPVTIVENQVESIEYKPANPIEFIVNTNGYWETNGDDSFFVYNFEIYNDGDKLTVKYKDGTSKVYTYDGKCEGVWVDPQGNELDFDYLDYYDNQYSDHWTVGSDNYYTLAYYGAETKIPVTITESPVKSIDYTPVKPIEIVENTRGYWDTDDYNEKYFAYYIPDYSDGDKLTVYYTDGTSAVYTFDGCDWKDLKGNDLNYNYLNCFENQYSEHWTADRENYFTISYFGVDTNVPVTIRKEQVCTHNNTKLINVKSATCIKSGYTGDTYCEDCGKIIEYGKTTPATGHKYTTVTTKATVSKNGSVVTKCSVCGAVASSKTINSPKTVALSSTSYTYDGKLKKPAVTVKDNAGKVISSSNYSVTYSNNKNVGTGTVKVTFKGSSYSGTLSKTFVINPKNTSISGVTAQYKGFTVKLNKYTTQTTGYQIQYSTSSKFSASKTITVNNTTTSKTVTGLATKKKYYVRVRTYKKVGNKNYYSSWSGAKSVTTSSYPTTITLSTTSYTYNGKAKKPSVTVKNNGKKISSKYYTVSYSSGRKSVGQYTVSIKFKKPYSGTVKKTFTIKPKSTSVSKVSSGKKKFTVKWKKQTSQTSGYQIQYSTSSKFKSSKTVTVSGNENTSKSVTKLSAKKKYYVRVRTYKTVKVSGKSTKIYSSWSKAVSVTTKK